MTAIKKLNRISIIGLGQMGKKLAQLYTDAGLEVFVWNRTRERASDLINVTSTDTVEDALSQSSLIIICVHNNHATAAILQNAIRANLLTGKTIVNLTTGSPVESQELEQEITLLGGHYLNGAIQVAPDQMGLKDTTILLSGDKDTYSKHKSFLDILGGNLKWLGDKASASSAMDMATLTWLYGSYVGLIYGVKLSQQYNLKLEDFSQIIGEVTPGYTEFFKYEINVIRGNDFRITQSPLSISVPATQRIADTFKELKVMQDFPQAIANILRLAGQRGLGNEEVAAIIKVIENPE